MSHISFLLNLICLNSLEEELFFSTYAFSLQIFSSTKQTKSKLNMYQFTLKAGDSPRIILQKTQSPRGFLCCWSLESEAQSKAETGKGWRGTRRESSERIWEERMASLRRASIFKRKRCFWRRLWQWQYVSPWFLVALPETEFWNVFWNPRKQRNKTKYQPGLLCFFEIKN